MAGVRFLPLLLLALLVSGACLPSGDDDTLAPGELPKCTWAQVRRVSDGDTIVVDYEGREERVRYIGIDTPEISTSGGWPEPFGELAAKRNEELIGRGRVCLERDITERDRYGRLLRYVWNDEGTLINEVLLREGLARVTTYPPDVKYVESRYVPAQREAEAARRGIWQ